MHNKFITLSYDFLLDYFNQHPEKRFFFINDLVLDLKVSEPILSKKLLNLTEKYPSIGTYNRTTGWFQKSELYFPLKTKKKNSISLEMRGIFVLIILSFLINSSLLLLVSLFLILGLYMNEIFDKMSYLKEYKL